MRVHANAKLGPAGRLALVGLVGEGVSLRAAASACGVAVATAHRWWHRWQDASAEARARSLGGGSQLAAASIAAAARAR